jgi:hypothetical protein
MLDMILSHLKIQYFCETNTILRHLTSTPRFSRFKVCKSNPQ